MKRELPIRTKNFIESIICGACWFFGGLLSGFDNKICLIISSIILLGSGFVLVFLSIVNAEEGDEMSELHYLKAKARTYDTVLLIFLLFAVIGGINRIMGHEEFISKWRIWILMLIGLMQIYAGVLFSKYEKDGDD